MKKFGLHLLITLFILFLASLLLDVAYTKVLSTSSSRNKVEHVMHSKNKNYDVVIMGTSRANNHFVTELFEKKGLKAFNYGMSGSHFFETDLLLKKMLDNQFKIKTLLLEADLSVCNEKRDEGTTARFMPYMHGDATITEHLKSQEDYFQLYYLPFYRYIKFDNKIGLREVLKVLKNEPTNVLHNKGYYPLLTTKSGKMKNDISTLKPIRNRYLEDVKKLCAQNNIQLILVMTPMCENTKGLDYFEKVNQLYPEIHNFENVVHDDNYFSSCGHLNDAGARMYTNFIINKFYK